jgi:biopolymer transport protein TolR
MGASGRQDDDETIATINVTPLVDIVLVLLIVLMVTSSYLVNKAISVELPKAATGETTNPNMSISVDQAGKLYLDGVAIDAPALQLRVRAAHQSDPDVKAIISADGRVHHSEVVAVIDLLRSEKVTKFAINTSPIEQPKAK